MSSQVIVPSPRAGRPRRTRRAARWSSSRESGSPVCRSTVWPAQEAGWGSQGSPVPKPRGAVRPDHANLRRTRIAVPERVSALGFDDRPPADWFDLSTVARSP
ncbi:hypothetical protein [Streptomyces massasporeus]|uniref:hypothetical protein n=1 Tax=Streptomyces massasporeus TaxID=67324 RepID=UPI003660DC56